MDKAWAVRPESRLACQAQVAAEDVVVTISPESLKAWLDDGHILVDGAVWAGKQRLEGNETITATLPEATQETDAQPEDIPLEIIFEDEHLIIINKPPGLVVHPGAGNREGTLLNALLHHAPELANVARAGIVHRRDKDTSGGMMVARTPQAQTHLVRQLQTHAASREYVALVHGAVRKSGTVEGAIGRHGRDRSQNQPCRNWPATHDNQGTHGPA